MEAALDAIGGRVRVAHLKSVRTVVVKHTLLMEQSYRQAPFLTAYARDVVSLDLSGKRLRDEMHMSWPGSDLGAAEIDSTLVGSLEGAIYLRKESDVPAGLAAVESVRRELELGPLSLLQTAATAPDLHIAQRQRVYAALDDVVAFTWRGVAVRIALDPDTHLPDAVDTTQQFDDFWFYWGDVRRRIYFDNWRMIHGVRYPTTEIEERNGVVWESRQAVDAVFDSDMPPDTWKMDGALAAKSIRSKGRNAPVSPEGPVEISPGIDLYTGAWNTTVIAQRDGLVVLEAPISEAYVSSVVAAAKQRHPALPVKAVLATSDSWPHVGGLRTVVARGWPTYILDLNRPLYDRMVAARHTLVPDELARSPRKPKFHVITNGQTLGDGDNRMVLYPLRGITTSRQYSVYFPARRLLYASDTLVINPDGSLYDPEMMVEVSQLVQREQLAVDRVYAMHQEPVSWSRVMALVTEATTPIAPAAVVR